jgi:hypothetical protein
MRCAEGMRKRRWKAPGSYGVAYYHCVSRVVDRQYVLGPEEREQFVRFMSEYLRLRVRYFADGAVLGRRQYVDEMFGAMRERFGPKRRDGARRLKGVKADLYSLRALRIGPVG